MNVQICRQCGGRCVFAESMIQETKERSRTEFWRKLPLIAAYPLRGGGFSILLIGTIFFMFTEYIFTFMGLFSGVMGVIVAGFMCKYYVKVIRSSARGIDRPPSWGEIEFTDWGDLIAAFFRTAAVALFCGAAPVIYLILTRADASFGVFFLLVALGIFYYPMALLAVLYYESILEVNPVTIFRSIVSALYRYIVVVIVFFAVAVVGWLLFVGLALLEIPVLGTFLHRFVSLYFYAMTMYLLGMFLYTNKETLGWD